MILDGADKPLKRGGGASPGNGHEANLAKDRGRDDRPRDQPWLDGRELGQEADPKAGGGQLQEPILPLAAEALHKPGAGSADTLAQHVAKLAVGPKQVGLAVQLAHRDRVPRLKGMPHRASDREPFRVEAFGGQRRGEPVRLRHHR